MVPCSPHSGTKSHITSPHQNPHNNTKSVSTPNGASQATVFQYPAPSTSMVSVTNANATTTNANNNMVAMTSTQSL